MSNTTGQSPVLDLLDIVWRHSDQATSHSWSRVNTSMKGALSLAIGSGMRFGRDDFWEIAQRYRFHYWAGNTGGFAEWFYCLAVVEGNLSACRAFEHYKNRKPFIVEGVSPGSGPTFAHRSGFRETGRLCVGATFTWNGEQVTVTSFAEDGKSLVACSYRDPGAADRDVGPVLHKRYRIAPRDIREQRRAAQAEAA